MLRAHRVAAIAERVHAAGARLLYDASHVAGLVAEGRFQAPLRDGADLMTFSTYKSFGGPAGGVIVGDDAAVARRLAHRNLLLSEIGCPAADGPDPAGAIRIGTQTLTTLGFGPVDMVDIADVLAKAVADGADDPRLRARVRAIRRRRPAAAGVRR
jgi:glycine/serine hydroxymethyltransferase